MWPVLLDMTEDESLQSLRHLELEAYSALISALRAQGPLDSRKKQILSETGQLLNISTERHKAEVRRAINDEKLNTIAYHITGHINTVEEWAQEGRRKIPLLPRTPPITPYSVIADEASEAAAKYNETLPLPSNTERKRPVAVHAPPPLASPAENGKSSSFRVPDVPKEEHRRRRPPSISENGLNFGLLGSKGLSSAKIQQVYRHISKKHKPRHKLPETQTAKSRNSVQDFILHTRPAQEMPSKHINFHEIRKPYHEPQFAQRLSPPNLPVNMNMPQNVQVYGPQTYNHQMLPTKTEPVKIEEEIVTIETPQMAPKTLSLSINKLAKLNVDKLKIIPNSTLQMPIRPLQNIAMPKPKMVTIKGNSGKKVIPLSQLQMLHPKGGGLKVLPPSAAVNLGKFVKEQPILTQVETKPTSPFIKPIKVEINNPTEVQNIRFDDTLELNEEIVDHEIGVEEEIVEMNEELDKSGSSTDSTEETFETVEEVNCEIIDGGILGAGDEFTSWPVI